MGTTTWIILAVVSLIFSALFSGTEIAYITSDRVRIELDVNRGGLLGKMLNLYYKNEELFISTILVGNNIVLVIYGMGAAYLIEDLWLNAYNLPEALVLIISTLISTGVILITGEFLPKSIFRINPYTSLKIIALPMAIFYFILYPVSMFTSQLSRLLMRLFGIKTDAQKMDTLSIGDLNRFLDTNLDEINPGKAPVETEVKIFHNALDFSKTHVRDCMIPRNELVAVNIANTTRENLSQLFTESGRSKILVYADDIDNILGYIHVSELFTPEIDWKKRIKPVIFAPESLLANKLMRRLLSEKRSMAIVVDEFGGTAGLVTLEDLVEEIFGDIRDEHDTASVSVKEIEPGVFECSGRVEIEVLRKQYHIDIPENDDYQTLAGFVLTSTGIIPANGETVTIDGYDITVLQRTNARLELLKLKKSTSESE